MPTPANTFEIEARSSSLPPFRKKLRSLLEGAGFDDKPCHDILLSVDEVLTNVIRHGYGHKAGENDKDKIHVSFADFRDRIEIQVEDRGPCFDPRELPAPKLPSTKPGGLGIHLVRSLMDKIDYEPLRPQGNRLRLVKYKRGRERERN